ncbi:MAG: uroporphyrinogen-III synthase [Aureispira sp.]
MAAQKRIFISRNVGTNSPFNALLKDRAIIEAQSLISFEEAPIQQLPVCDWLFFYSKKGLDFGWPRLQALNPLPKIAVLGKASAEHWKQKFGKVADFVGTGAPAPTAEAFLAIAKEQRVCFVQAQHSRQSIALLLGTQVRAATLVVYTNTPKAIIDIPPCDILVFTSPLNAQAYYQKYPIKRQQYIIAIGQTTAKALEQLGVSAYSIAAAPHERALANCCLSLL